MAEVQEPKKVESETPSPPAPAPAPEPTEVPTDVAEEKSVIPPPPPPPEEKPEDSKALAVVEPIPDSVEEKPVEEKPAEGSINRDAVLARVATEKRTSLIKAWEESEKSKAENKAQKKLSEIGAWENTKKANEKLEKQKAAYVETMKNKVAIIHKEAEEKRAIIEARRGEDLLKAEEIAAKYRATGTAPKKLLGCF
ncbi:hypothetical protein C3L33_03210, partial [Rhododendron williamsianum]